MAHSYTRTPQSQSNVIANLNDSLAVFRCVYDQIGCAAIETAERRSAPDHDRAMKHSIAALRSVQKER